MDLSRARLFNLGTEQAIEVYDPDGDNLLDTEDHIAFYGRTVASPYAKYTRYNVYWLTASGDLGSLNMAAVDGTAGSAQIAGTHTFRVHHEQDTEWVGWAPGGDGVDRWFFFPFVSGSGVWGGGGQVDFTLNVPGVAGQGNLKIAMTAAYDTNHEVEVYLNGALLETVTWGGLVNREITIDPVTLLEGNNTVGLKCLSGSDPLDPDVLLVDWFIT